MPEFKIGDIGKFVSLGVQLIPLITIAIQSVEGIVGASGEAKKAAVMAAVRVAFPALEKALGKDIGNDPAVFEAVSNYIDAFVALQKAAAASARVKVQPV